LGNWVFQRFLTLISLVLLTKQQSESWNVSLFRISTVWLVVIFSHQIVWKLCSCLDLLSYKSGTGCECKGLWIFIKEGDHQPIIGYQIIGKKFVKTWCHNWIFSILLLVLMNIKLYLKFRNTGPLPVFLCWHFVNTTITRMELFSEELSTHSIHLFVSVLLQPLLLTPTFRLVLVYPSTVYNSIWIFHAKFNRNNCSIVPPLNPFSPSLCVCEFISTILWRREVETTPDEWFDFDGLLNNDNKPTQSATFITITMFASSVSHSIGLLAIRTSFTNTNIRAILIRRRAGIMCCETTISVSWGTMGTSESHDIYIVLTYLDQKLYSNNQQVFFTLKKPLHKFVKEF